MQVTECAMTIESARTWIIIASLALTGCQLMFFIVAPVVGFPLETPNNIELLRIVLPVFLGYLGSASHFVFKCDHTKIRGRAQYLGILVIGPLLIYTLAVSG